MSNKDSSTKDFLLGALIGSVVGAVTAILLTPKSGKDIRGDIKEYSTKVNADELRKKGQNLFETAKEKSSQIGQAVTEQTNQILSKFKDVKQTDKELDEVAEENGENVEKQYIPLQTYDEAAVQKKLEETKKAFDETEKSLNQ